MTALLATGLALLALAAVLDLFAGTRRAGPLPVPYLLCAIGSGCLLGTGIGGLAGRRPHWDLGEVAGLNAAGLAIDPLAGLFLVVAFGVAAPVCLATASWVRGPARVRRTGLAAAFALTLAAVAVIITASDVFVFLFGWEALTFAFYLLAGHERALDGGARASLVTIVFGKSSGALLLLGFLQLVAGTGSFALASLGGGPHGAGRSAAYALLVLGFAVKVGLVPVQIWMPGAYAAAPAGARALMAAVAVNVGFYGLWRTLQVLGPPPAWLGVTVLLLASFTALLGIAHAAVQTSLVRVIAYSSVENAGLIVTGYGVALVGASIHNKQLLAVGLLAGSLQVVAHAMAKALLFSTTASIEAAYGTAELDLLRGVGRRLPWSAAGFAVGAATLAGLPLTVGFASEWFLLESLMQQFRLDDLTYSMTMAVSGALVALTVGFAGVTFVRVVGLTLLGPTSEKHPRRARRRDLGAGGRIAACLLAAGCLAVAAVTPLEVRVLARGLNPLVPGTVTTGALKSPWVLQPVFAEFSILSPSWLWVAMPVLLAGVVGLLLIASRAGALRVRRVPAWRSATGGVEGEDQYTPFGYTNPTRKVLANVLLTRSQLTDLEQHSGGQVGDEDAGTAGAHLGYTSDVVEVVAAYVYGPIARPLGAAVRTAKRLQSGRLDAYVAYMLIALIAVIAVVTGVS